MPPSTFALWRRELRTRSGLDRPRRRRTFARVEVVGGTAVAAAERTPGITLVVRARPGLEVELTGLDVASAASLVRAVLTRRGGG